MNVLKVQYVGGSWFMVHVYTMDDRGFKERISVIKMFVHFRELSYETGKP